MLAIIIGIVAEIIKDAPEALALWRQYEPEVVRLVATYGPELEAAVVPMIKASAANGTLVSDIEALMQKGKAVAPLLGTLTSIGDLAAAIGDIQPVDAANPTPDQDRAARPTKMGGR